MSAQLPLAGEEEEEPPKWVISLLEPTKQDFERNYIPWNILRTRKQVPAAQRCSEKQILERSVTAAHCSSYRRTWKLMRCLCSCTIAI